MNEKLQKLYQLYVDEGLITDATPIEKFAAADDSQIDALYTLGKNNNLFQSTDIETFKTAFSTPVESTVEEAPIDLTGDPMSTGESRFDALGQALTPKKKEESISEPLGETGEPVSGSTVETESEFITPDFTVRDAPVRDKMDLSDLAVATVEPAPEKPSMVAKLNTKALTPELIAKDEEDAVPELNKMFGEFFEFEEAGTGYDAVLVKSKKTGNKKIFTLDAFTDAGDVKNTRKIKEWMERENGPTREEVNAYYQEDFGELATEIADFNKKGKELEAMTKVIESLGKTGQIKSEKDPRYQEYLKMYDEFNAEAKRLQEKEKGLSENMKKDLANAAIKEEKFFQGDENFIGSITKGDIGKVLEVLDTWSENRRASIEFGDLIDGLAGAVATGAKQAELVNHGMKLKRMANEVTDEDLLALMRTQEEMANMPLSKEMQQYHLDYDRVKEEGGSGLMAFITAISNNPQASLELTATSLRAMLNENSLAEAAKVEAAAAAAGGAASLVTGGLAAPVAIPAAMTKAIPIATAMAGATMEVGITVAEGIREHIEAENAIRRTNGQEPLEYNPETIRMVLQDEEVFNKIVKKGLVRGATIGAVEGILTAIGAKAGSAIFSKTGSRVLQAGFTAPLEMIGEGIGEGSAQLLTDGKLDWKEVYTETAGGAYGTVTTMLASTQQDGEYTINGGKVDKVELNKIIDSATAEELTEMEIDVKGDKKTYDKLNNKIEDKKIVDSMPEGLTEEEQQRALELERELKVLEENKTDSVSHNKKVSERKSELNELYDVEGRKEKAAEEAKVEAEMTEEEVAQEAADLEETLANEEKAGPTTVESKTDESPSAVDKSNKDLKTPRNENISMKGLAKKVANAAKALPKGMKIVVHKTQAEYEAATKKTGNAVFRPERKKDGSVGGTIHINAAKANARTVAHEVLHARIVSKLGGVASDINKSATALYNKVKDAADLTEQERAWLDNFRANYIQAKIDEKAAEGVAITEEQAIDMANADEEFLAELAGIVSQKGKAVSRTFKAAVMDFFMEIANKFGANFTTSQEALDFINSVGLSTEGDVTIQDSAVDAKKKAKTKKTEAKKSADREKTVEKEQVATVKQEIAKEEVQAREQQFSKASSVDLFANPNQLDVKREANGRTKVLELGKAFDKRARELGTYIELPKRGQKYTDAQIDKIATAMADDAELQLKQDASGIGWYDTKTKSAIELMSRIHPELATEGDGHFRFTLMVALISQNNTVDINFKQANEAYTYYKENGKLPNRDYAGKSGNIIKENLKSSFDSIDKIGWSKFKDILKSTKTVKEWKNLGYTIAGENQSTKITGAMAILGSKIGSFWGNLNGDFSTLTADLWFSRMFNRYTGNVVAKDTSESSKKTVLSEVKSYKGDKLLYGYNKADILEGGAIFNEWVNKITNDYIASGYKDKNKLSIAANTHYKNLKGSLQDVPRGGNERLAMRLAVQKVQDKLIERGYPKMDIADIQAVVWYNEKDLYRLYKAVNKSSEKTDYETAAQKVLRGKGINADVALQFKRSQPTTNAGRNRATSTKPIGAPEKESRVKGRQQIDIPQVMAVHNEGGGSSINQEGQNIFGTKNYSVSVHPDRSKIIDGKEITEEDILDFAEANADLLEDKMNFIGTWYNEQDGKTYMDISTYTPDKQKAIDMARKANQIAIYDLYAAEEIDTEGTGEAMATERQQVDLPRKVDDVLTKNEDGQYVFKHYSQEPRKTVKPMAGDGRNLTGRGEAQAISTVGGLAMYYVSEGQKEAGVGDSEHTVTIEPHRVYYFNEDAENFYDEAERRFKAKFPSQAFTPNHQVAWITKVANENGYDMVISNWRNPKDFRAQTTLEMTPDKENPKFKKQEKDTIEVGDTILVFGAEADVTAVNGNRVSFKGVSSSGTTMLNRVQKLATEREQANLNEATERESKTPKPTAEEVVRIGRENGFSDAAIKRVLEGKGFTEEQINDAMSLNVDLFTTLPDAFVDVKGGIKEGTSMFNKVLEKLKRLRKKRTPAEMAVEAITKLRETSEYKNQNKTTQAKLESAIKQHFNSKKVNYGKQRAKILNLIKNRVDLKTLKKEFKNFINNALPDSDSFTKGELKRLLGIIERVNEQNFETEIDKVLDVLDKHTDKLGALKSKMKEVVSKFKQDKKNLKESKIQLKNFIRKSLPKSDNYSQAKLNRLILAVTNVDETNFNEQAEKVLKIVDQQRAIIKKSVLKRIKALVADYAKKGSTSDRRARAGKLAAEGQQFFQDIKPIVDAALSGDVDTLIKYATLLSSDSDKLNAVAIKEQNGEPLSTTDKKLLNQVYAFDNLVNLKDMSLEEVQDILNQMLEGGQFFTALMKADRMKRSIEIAEKHQEAKSQIESTMPEMYVEVEEYVTVKDSQGRNIRVKKKVKKLVSKNRLNDRKKSLVQALKKLDIPEAIQAFWQNLTDPNKSFINAITSSFHLNNLATITNILDRATRGKNFFRENLRDALAVAEEYKLRGINEKKTVLDKIASTISGVKNYKQIRDSLLKGSVKIKLAGNNGVKNTDKNQLLRIYALSLNTTQRAKLIKQGWEAAQMEEVKSILGPKAIEFADKIVEYLSNTYYEEVNAVYKDMNFVNLPYIEDYFPTRTLTQSMDKDLISGGNFNAIFNAENAPALKERVDIENEVDEQYGFVDALERHIETMEKYKAYAAPVRTINDIFRSPDVSSLLMVTGLEPALRQALNFAISPSSVGKLAGEKQHRYLSNFTGFVLALKPMQFIKQAVSFFGAYEKYQYGKKKNFLLDLIPYSLDVADLIVHLPVDIFSDKGPIRTAMKESATFKARVISAFKGETFGLVDGSQTIKPVSQSSAWYAKGLRLVKAISQGFTTMGDIAGVAGYIVVYRRNIKNGMSKQEAVRQFNDYNETQQSRYNIDKVPLQMNPNILQRAFTMFLSSQFLFINKVNQSTMNITRSLRDKKLPRTQDIRALTLNLAIQNMLFVAAANIFKMIRGDEEDKEDFWQQVKDAAMGLNQVYAIPLLGTAAETAVRTSRGQRTYGSDVVNPLNRIVAEIQKAYEDGDYSAIAKEIAGLAVGINIDPIVGLYNYFKDMDDTDAMYDAMGVSNSYRPEDEKKGKKRKPAKRSGSSSAGR